MSDNNFLYHEELEDILLMLACWVDEQDSDHDLIRAASGTLEQMNEATIVIGGIRADAVLRWREEGSRNELSLRQMAGNLGLTHQRMSKILNLAERRLISGLARLRGQSEVHDAATSAGP